MSSDLQASSSSAPNFRPIFEKALEEYEKKTGKDLTAHPLAIQIKNCDSPEAILIVLQGKANELNQSRSNDERLTKWLNPTVNILNALSATFGDTAGEVFPPAKIIFSGIGILLVAAKGTAANRDVLVKLFGRIESFFERLKIYTNVPPSPAVTNELAKIMAEVLSILATATRGIKERRIKIFFKKVAGINGLEDALQKFGELEQRELLTDIAQVTSDTNVLKDDVKETKADAKETKAMVKEIAEKMGARDLEEALQKLKGWLSPPDPSTNYNIGLRDLHEATATWFLEGRIFQKWNSTGSLLWIHGKPGSGKSILCSAIIQRILSLRHGGRASVAYFYFDFRDENKKHRHNLLPSLLIQFAAHSIPCCDIMSRVYSAHGKGTQQPSDDVLITCLKDMLSATTQHPIYIIVDALDESPNTSGVRSPRDRVLSFITGLLDLGHSNLHICVTSRPEIDIRVCLEPLTSLRVSLHDQTGHKKDINKYIRSEVDVIANQKRWRVDDRELVIETLSEKADGMFRWVYCQLEMLRLCLRSRVRQFLNELPDSLDETYERVLKDIHKTNQDYAQRLLQCLTVAIRPLSVDELAAILTFDADAIEGEVPTLDADWWSEDQEQELLSACPSLITIVGRHNSRVVQFSHFSVKEFLTSDRLAVSSEDILRYHVLPEAAHTTLARGSLGILLRLDERTEKRIPHDGWVDPDCDNWWSNRGDGDDGWNDIRNNPPLDPPIEYAAQHWVSHAQVGSVSSHVMGRMKTLFDLDKPHFAAWIRTYDIDWGFSGLNAPWKTAKPLYYSALCGFYDLVEYLARKNSQHVNDFGGKHDYPLGAALYGGHIRAAELLFQLGANVDVRGTNEQTPLHRVTGWPHHLAVSAVPFLLEHGADVNVQGKGLSAPLHLAAGWGNVEARDSWNPVALPISKGDRFNLVKLLLEHGAEVNSRVENNSTALHYALLMRDIDVARVLLDHGANIDAKDNWGRTPLLRMLEDQGRFDEDRWAVAQLLVEQGADVNAQDKDHHTPLHFVTYFLELNLARMLLDHGANVNAEDNTGRTPLHLALEDKDYHDEDRFGVAQLLVERGADVNARDKDNKTPLHFASYFPELKLVWMFLDHGATVNARDNLGRTPLLQVLEADDYVDEHRFSVTCLLVERGADVNVRDEGHETPLHYACYPPELKLVQILLDHGANINAVDKWGRTPLHRMLEAKDPFDEDRLAAAQLLVERGADVNVPDKDHETPLHFAAHFLELDLMWILLDHGANVDAEDNLGRTLLLRMLESGDSADEPHFGVAQLLVERGADVNVRDKDHETPLHYACYPPKLKIVRMLLDSGANVNAEDNLGRAPLLRMLEAGGYADEHHLNVARLLVERGADVNVRDEHHKTPLHYACYPPELELVQTLLDHGANINAVNKWGRTPLHRMLAVKDLSDEDRSAVALVLVERGADVNARDEDNKTPLHYASYPLELDLLRMLLDHGANVDAEDNLGRTPLLRVLEAGGYADEHHWSAQLLVERGADVNVQDRDHETPLHYACYPPKLKLARMLLDNGANINAVDKWGRTPLHRMLEAKDSSDEDRSAIAQLLVERGADVNARDEDHETPLHFATHFLELDLMRILLDHGANVNSEDSLSRTPLHLVLEAEDYFDNGGSAVAQLLIEHGADVNTPNGNHDTPLHIASRLVMLEAAWILLKSGADLNVKNKEDQLPFQLLRETIREEMQWLPSVYSIRLAAGRARRAECVALMGLLYGH